MAHVVVALTRVLVVLCSLCENGPLLLVLFLLLLAWLQRLSSLLESTSLLVLCFEILQVALVMLEQGCQSVEVILVFDLGQHWRQLRHELLVLLSSGRSLLTLQLRHVENRIDFWHFYFAECLSFVYFERLVTVVTAFGVQELLEVRVNDCGLYRVLVEDVGAHRLFRA